ncbi:MAG: chorismate-binding protein [Verrucomicrobiota bacterium]
MQPVLRQHPRPIHLDGATPEEIAARLHTLPGFVFLDSSSRELAPPPNHPSPSPRDSFSLITARPEKIVRGHLDNPASLRQYITHTSSQNTIDCGFPTGGAFGTVSFDGSFTFGIYPHVLAFHHPSGEWFEVGNMLSRNLATAKSPHPKPFHPAQPLHFQFETPQEVFIQAIMQAKEYIRAGDIYQVNLSHRAIASWPALASPFDLYRTLRHVSPAPFSAFLQISKAQSILSSSPELFLRLSGNAIRTCPIKGTRPRKHEPAGDEKSAYDLLTSPKEIAELIMITDLERNDLGQVCEFASVQASELLKLERFAQVFHLVSTVDGTLRPEIDHLDALKACFPGGSISGAPKKRALEIIQELEGTPRNLYTGAVGYLGTNGESQFNIAIRTLLINHPAKIAHFHVGAGIVADSIPEKEYKETLHKAAGILAATKAWNQKYRPLA